MLLLLLLLLLIHYYYWYCYWYYYCYYYCYYHYYYYYQLIIIIHIVIGIIVVIIVVIVVIIRISIVILLYIVIHNNIYITIYYYIVYSFMASDLTLKHPRFTQRPPRKVSYLKPESVQRSPSNWYNPISGSPFANLVGGFSNKRHWGASSHFYSWVKKRNAWSHKPVYSRKFIWSKAAKAPLSLALGLAAFALAFALGLVDFGCFVHPDPLSTWDTKTTRSTCDTPQGTSQENTFIWYLQGFFRVHLGFL